MNALQLFLFGHARTHTPEVGEVSDDFSYEAGIWRGLSEPQIRVCPEGLNSIAWLFWHIARTEDVIANLMVGDGHQVLDEENWADRMGVSDREFGMDMTKAQVARISAAIDLAALRAYRRAVGRNTRQVTQSLPPEQWDAVVESAVFGRVLEQGALAKGADRELQFWSGRTRAWFLQWMITEHSYSHLGQMRLIRILARRTAPD